MPFPEATTPATSRTEVFLRLAGLAGLAGLAEQAARSRAIIEAHDLDEVGNQASAGTARIPRPWSGSCFTCSRSTPGTSATWTS